MRLLDGSSSIGTSLKEEFALEVHAPFVSACMMMGSARASCRRSWIDAVIADLDRRDALADAEQEPAAAHLVEHADFFGQPQRMIERQRVDQRAEMQPLGALRDRRKDARRRGHPERREMVLGAMIAVEAGTVVGLDQLEAVLVEIRQRQVAARRRGRRSRTPSIAPRG